MTDTELVRAAVEQSGLSASRFASEVLSRDPRTVRRWLAGQPLPKAVRPWLERYLAVGEKAALAKFDEFYRNATLQEKRP